MDSGCSHHAAAAQHPRADVAVAKVLAVKALDHLASRYLVTLRDRLFEAH